jgi:hypothetical protein
MASMMVIFSLAGVPIEMLNELTQLAVPKLLNGADCLNEFPNDQLQARAYLFTRLHGQGLLIAQIFWGLWLFPMGYLAFKSGLLPRILASLLEAVKITPVIDRIYPLGEIVEAFRYVEEKHAQGKVVVEILRG